MTPGQPRPVRRDPMSTSTVQKWVMSILATSTIWHLAVGLVVAAAYLDTTGKKIAMLVIASAFGVIGMVAARLIHQVRVLTPWLLVGLIPTAAGVWFIFLR
jgi:hypothetical protein